MKNGLIKLIIALVVCLPTAFGGLIVSTESVLGQIVVGQQDKDQSKDREKKEPKFFWKEEKRPRENPPPKQETPPKQENPGKGGKKKDPPS